MCPLIPDSCHYSALSLLSPRMASHVSSCWAVSDFPNRLTFFLEQGRVRPDFSSSHPQNSRCESPTGLTRTMSGKEPDKMLSAGSSVSSHAARGLGLRDANHIQAHAQEQVQLALLAQLHPHPALLTAQAA